LVIGRRETIQDYKIQFERKVWDWYHRIDLAPYDWVTLQALLHQKYGVYDEDELNLKMDAVH
jgi:hypothetical protein